jgi:hypothetical protein
MLPAVGLDVDGLSNAPEDGHNYCPKHVELTLECYLLLNLVDCFLYYTNDARSINYQISEMSYIFRSYTI